MSALTEKGQGVLGPRRISPVPDMLLGSRVGTLQEDVIPKLSLKEQMRFYLVKKRRNVERFWGKEFREESRISVRMRERNIDSG